MARPMPAYPRGPRRRREGPPRLEVPVQSPQFDLHALRALVKPHDYTREAIRHRVEIDGEGEAEQPWSPAAGEAALAALADAAERLGVEVEGHLPRGGAAHFFALFAPGTPPELVRATGACVSARVAETWLTLGRLALRGGRFYRNGRGAGGRWTLVRAADVHLPRDIRARVADLLRPPRPPADR